MPKVIVSIDEVVIKEVQLTKDRTTLGRRPYNDIVIDNLAISGEHAVFLLAGGQVTVEDLNSTNGTYLNGRAIKKQQLNDGDSIEVGKYKVKFVGDGATDNFDKTMVVRARPAVQAAPVTEAAPSGYSTQAGDSTGLGAGQASIKVMSGGAAGREVPLTKVVTTIGKPGVAVAAITRRQQGFVVHHVEGAGNPTLNGAPISSTPLALKNGDLIELAGTQMQFVLT
ncbi:FHA domain-containing protein [Curvibacter sp. APW13]|uniref:FHA domain-containing protein n=1 Tax=Curvibacter sp. APW13 TaxID=3077236 RepID=UPI0028DFE2F8|nr:FHA domain-containing protein [Curvibacter sp. APW13]MDT8990145.1 FHA domain-containing protein [Curvibacter sp. APW13]